MSCLSAFLPSAHSQRTAILLVLAPLFGHAASAPEDRVLTPHRVAELHQVAAAVVSPDGRHTAYTVAVPRRPGIDEDGEAWTELWVAARAESAPRRFVAGRAKPGTVRWTPDGREIAFLAKREGDRARSLYLVPLAGGEARRILAPAVDIADYSFAPDGERVAYLLRDAEDESVRRLRDKGFRAEVYEEDWRFQRVWTSRLGEAGGAAVKLNLDGHARAVRWSPTGDRLLVVVTPTPGVDDSLIRQRLRVVAADSGGLVARIDNPGKLGAFAWSPDGRRIAFISAVDQHDPSAGRLMVADASTGAFQPVFALDWAGDVSDVAWLDPDTLAYLATEGVETFAGRVRADERAARPPPPLVATGGVAFSLSVAGEGRAWAWVAHTPAHPAELFHWTPGAKAARRTISNPWLTQLRLAPQEVVRHRARDGLELAGILVRPLGEQRGRRYPLILAVHGGPEAYIGHGWVTSYSNPGQVAAARGMAVYYPNYRGSTGRGVAFSKLGQGDAAGREFDDLIDAVDHLVAAGLVDRAKVGVTGGSYGGYATAWCSTRFSERFAAGVMSVGISNKISKVGTTDIPDEEFLVHALKRPWDDWQFLLERSPIYHTAQARTPLLILHGKDDPRVHVGQSRELHRHLKLRGQAPVRLILYPGEEHGNRKAAARLDFALRQLQWLEHYLTGPGGPPPPHALNHGLPAPVRD